MPNQKGPVMASQGETPATPSRREFLKYAVGGVAVAGAAAVAGSAYYKYSYLPSQAPSTFILGISPALTTDVVLAAAKNQGYFGQNKLAPTFQPFTDQNSALSAFLAGKFEVHWDGNLAALANGRAKGSEVQGIYWATNATNNILVAKDSPYQSIYDIKGKPVGTITLPSQSFILASEVWNANNPNRTLNPISDFSYSTGGLPLLNHNLLSGSLAAIETVEPFVTLGILSGARVLTTASDAWRGLTGRPIVGSLMGAQQSYASSNPSVIKEVIATWRQGVNYVKANPDFVNNFVKTEYNITDQSAIDQLRPSLYKFYDTDWSDASVSNLGQFLQLLKKYNIVSTVPPNLLTNSYNP